MAESITWRRNAAYDGNACVFVLDGSMKGLVAEYQRLDPRVIPLQRLIGRFVTAGLSLLLLGALLSTLELRRWGWALAAWLVASAAIAWFFHRWPEIEYRHYSYRLDDDGVEIRSSVFWQSIVNVPRSRVQHTDVVQGPLERQYGLGRLVIYTAGTEHSKVELAGLEYHDALRIRDQLLPHESDDAV